VRGVSGKEQKKEKKRVRRERGKNTRTREKTAAWIKTYQRQSALSVVNRYAWRGQGRDDSDAAVAVVPVRLLLAAKHAEQAHECCSYVSVDLSKNVQK
jgi:hypothetical protein